MSSNPSPGPATKLLSFLSFSRSHRIYIGVSRYWTVCTATAWAVKPCTLQSANPLIHLVWHTGSCQAACEPTGHPLRRRWASDAVDNKYTASKFRIYTWCLQKVPHFEMYNVFYSYISIQKLILQSIGLVQRTFWCMISYLMTHFAAKLLLWLQPIFNTVMKKTRYSLLFTHTLCSLLLHVCFVKNILCTAILS